MNRIAGGSIALMTLALAACGNETREATYDTGTATATVTTEAPNTLVPEHQLDAVAAIAATTASTPVDGSGPVGSIAPKPNETTTGTPMQAK